MFQDEWFSDKKHLKWIVKAQTPIEASCLICKNNFDISLMGVSALASHASEKKHEAKLCGKNYLMDIIRLLSGASNKSLK